MELSLHGITEIRTRIVQLESGTTYRQVKFINHTDGIEYEVTAYAAPGAGGDGKRDLRIIATGEL